MAGFFENRQLAFNKGLELLDQGITDLGKGIFGKEEINEKSTGLTGAAISMVRAPLEALFDEHRGILNPKKGIDLNIMDENSSWNLMNLIRKAVGGVINTASTIITKPIDVLSPKVGENVDKIFRGLTNAILGLIVGDFSHYMGPKEEVAANDSNYPETAKAEPAADIKPLVKPKEEVHAKEAVSTSTFKGGNLPAVNDKPNDISPYSGGNPPAANEGNKTPTKLVA